MASASAGADSLKIYNWSEYLSPQLIERFERESGHQLQLTFFDNEGERDQVFLSNSVDDFDLILYDAHSLRVFGNNGYFTEVSDLAVTGVAQHSVMSREACGNWGVPYGWGTIGIAYRESLFDEPVSSWRSLFKPPNEPGRAIVMPMDEVDTVAVALLALGYPMDSEDRGHLNEARDLIQGQWPYLIDYGYSLTYAELHGGDQGFSMTLAYSGDEYSLQDLTGHDDWVFVVPDERTILWVDCWVSPSNNRRKDAVVAFLEFMNQPEVAAENADYLMMPTTHIAASEMLLQNSLGVQITHDSVARASRLGPLSTQAMRHRNELIYSLLIGFSDRKQDQER